MNSCSYMTTNITSLLKLIADQSRLNILNVLGQGSNYVTDLVNKTGLSQSLISHHLRDLKDAGLVQSDRNGRNKKYSLTTYGQQIASIKEINSSSLLKLIADQSRLNILNVLGQGSNYVTDLVNKTGLSQSLISHHLRDLKDAGLSHTEKQGRWVNYSLSQKGEQIILALEQINL